MVSNILGISAFYHDSAAALIQDGEIVAAAQEERFTRLKGDARFPRQAIAYCLNEAGIDVAHLDYVAFYEKPLVKFERLLETYLTFAPRGFPSFRRALPLWSKHKLRLPQRIRAELGREFRGQLCFTDHHESHAASAFFPSPFQEAAILTLDAVGEWSTSSIGMGRGNHITLTHEMRFPHSLGMLYSAFTYYTGFKVNSGEYKLMGLAPYGQPTYVEVILNNIAHIEEDGSLWLDMSYFNYCQGLTMTSEKFHRLFHGPPRDPDSFITQKEMDLAASIQVVCEEELSAHSQYCKVLHADDWLFPDCLTRMVEVANAHPSVGIVGAYRLCGDHVDLDGLPYPSTVVPGREICRSFLRLTSGLGGVWVFGSPSSLLIRSDLIRRRTCLL